MVVLYASGISLGVSMSARDWIEMTFLILLALVPFAALPVGREGLDRDRGLDGDPCGNRQASVPA